MRSESKHRIEEELTAYGVPRQNIRRFGQNPEPDLQNYLTLNALRRNDRPSPDGVVEHQGRPLLYFVDEQRFIAPAPGKLFIDQSEPAELALIVQQLACRGEPVYLARVEFGRIQVAPVSPTKVQPSWVEYTPDSVAGKCLFARLAHGITDGEGSAAGDYVFNRLFALLKHSANKIATNEELRPDSLSLVGRALFFRFLRDRGVLIDYPVSEIAPNASDWTDCFANAKNASSTCHWLDKTFNGDFLPLTDSGSELFFEKIAARADGGLFSHLTAIISGHEPIGGHYQPMLSWDWQAFDFAHIPVGLLSQVYEAFCWEWTPKDARRMSQRYTPRNIAVTLLNEVFDHHPHPNKIRVLDPACGAGVFLVLAFRRLYLENWKRSKGRRRPNTAAIRRILNNQLVGFDISEPALKLAALSLYLTAIELDPEPQPPDKLKFQNLRNRVLFDVREPSAKSDGPALGSLSPHLGARFNRRFDVVVSNPPWTSVDSELGKQMAKACRSAIKSIDKSRAENYQLPDNNPDLPFLWKATEWCKEGGRIAMALPSRILLKSKRVPALARHTLFQLLRIDGIINGTNLADTPVWPKMNQPWMLLFATNKRPPKNHSTYFVTLPLDRMLNESGRFRIDAKSALPVDPEAIAQKPWLWKTLSIGTTLDVDVVDKIKRAGGEQLDKYWKRVVGKDRTGKGYQIIATRKKGLDAKFLLGLPDLTTTDLFRFAVDSRRIRVKFNHPEIHRPRKRTIYDPPLVLIREAPRENRDDGLALLCFDRVAYDESYNGYSAAGYQDGETLVRYIHLFVHSSIWQYYLLATSPQFGAERRRAHKSDLGQFPIIPLERLSKQQKARIVELSMALEAYHTISWDAIDRFFAALYGLEECDLQVIKDTLSTAQPYDRARRIACRPPTQKDRNNFASTLDRLLSPFVEERSGVIVKRWDASYSDRAASPFDMVWVTAKDESRNGVVLDDLLEQITKLAEEVAATQVILRYSGGLLIGIYNQYRYWTPSRARLLAGEIVRYELDAITGGQ